jgi:hypothetical protein
LPIYRLLRLDGIGEIPKEVSRFAGMMLAFGDALVTDVVVTDEELRLDRIAGGWALASGGVDRFALVNEYLS